MLFDRDLTEHVVKVILVVQSIYFFGREVAILVVIYIQMQFDLFLSR